MPSLTRFFSVCTNLNRKSLVPNGWTDYGQWIMILANVWTIVAAIGILWCHLWLQLQLKWLTNETIRLNILQGVCVKRRANYSEWASIEFNYFVSNSISRYAGKKPQNCGCSKENCVVAVVVAWKWRTRSHTNTDRHTSLDRSVIQFKSIEINRLKASTFPLDQFISICVNKQTYKRMCFLIWSWACEPRLLVWVERERERDSRPYKIF